MPRPTTNGLTDHELSIIHVLWEEAPLSIADILQKIPKRPKPAYTSLLTTVQAMEKKGYLKHVKEGKLYIYSPLLKKQDFKKFELKKVAARLFNGNIFELAVNLIKEEKLSASEIKELKKVLEEL